MSTLFSYLRLISKSFHISCVALKTVEINFWTFESAMALFRILEMEHI